MDQSIYLRAQDENDNDYNKALNEIKAGKKSSCWIWYIFPILKIEELMADFYSSYFAFECLDDAFEYFAHPILKSRLTEITSVLLKSDDEIGRIIGSEIDKMKLWSCMTLFHYVSPETAVFTDVINKFYEGRMHEATVRMIGDKTNGEKYNDKKHHSS